MNATGIAFSTALGLCLFTASAAMIAPRPIRSTGTGIGTALAGTAAIVAGFAALTGETWDAWLPGLLPLAGVRLALDPLGGVFVAVTGAVAVATGIYAIGYTRGLEGRTAQAALPLFLASMLLVPAGAAVSTFMIAWEFMALTSLLLVLSEHRRTASVAQAGLWYAVMTHLGMVTILAGLVGFAAGAHGESFDRLRAGAQGLSPAARSAVFIATLIGFASKAGAVPLHAWLPRAHPEAPSHVSALMSAAMVNLGIYGIVRVGLDLLPGGAGSAGGTGGADGHAGPVWWWLVVLAVGGVSALYGILQAAVATDLKRLLAYSTCENMGLVLIGVGAAGFFTASGETVLAALAMTAALLHIVNHAGYKTLLFLAAGSVLHATGTRDLDRLGGLRGRLPATTALFAAGALAASALPPGNGFVSEWLLLQSLIRALPSGGTIAAVTMPVAVAVVALTAGLSVATFVKAFGVGFLARARSAVAERAHESPATMVAGMIIAAVACAALALAPTVVVPGLHEAVAVVAAGGAAVPADPLALRPPGVSSVMSPVLIVAGLLMGSLALLALLRLAAIRYARRAPVPRALPASATATATTTAAGQRAGRQARRRARLWDCGAGPMTPRMEYTATSFAEPLQRVFDNVLAPETDVDVTPLKESAYLVNSVAYRATVGDRIEARFYQPVLAAVARAGQAARGLANGSVHRYVGYGFYTFTALLVLLAVTW